MIFDRYDVDGAYHWAECDRRLSNWKRYNPALDARYIITTAAVAGLPQRGILLDVGCGDGMLMFRVASLMALVVGVDSERTAIGWAKEKLRACRHCMAIHTAGYGLPFKAQSIDVAVSAEVIEHVEEPLHHLSEICRVLKRGGALVLTTPKWRREGKWDPRHVKEYQPRELAEMLRAYFEDVTLTFFWPTMWSRLYDTRVGWRLLKLLSVLGFNPFTTIGREARGFGQILAVCRSPRPHPAP